MGLYQTFKILIDDLLFILYLTWDFFKNLFNLRRKYQGNTRLDGKVVVITGANTGIGKETALQMSIRGAKIIIGCRDVEKGQIAAQEIIQKSQNSNINVLKLDLSSLKCVEQFAKSVKEMVSQIDILVNNAGVMVCPEAQTEEGFEMQFGTNHLGHFLLTLLLLPLLKKSDKARVVTLASSFHMKGQIHFENINLRNNAYEAKKAYFQSKLANVLFTRELAKRLAPQSNVKVYCLHPGAIKTELWRHWDKTVAIFFIKLFFIGIEEGTQTTLFCALEESIENESGSYYESDFELKFKLFKTFILSDCKRIEDKWMVSKAMDDQSAKLLWELSCDMVKLEKELNI